MLAFSVFAWAPLLTPAYFLKAHDAQHSIFYLVQFDQTFRDGYLWPRWSPDFAFGYGYPLFNIYAPLAIYAAELLHLTGLGLTNSVKGMYILATIGAGLGMYGFVRHLFGPAAGVLAAVSYMYAPFHLVDIFVRSAYAEFVALAVIPFVFWAFTRLISQPTLWRVGLAALSYGLLALTHHTSFFTVTPFLMMYILYLTVAPAQVADAVNPSPLSQAENQIHALYRAAYALAAGVLGVALASIYLIPALLETKYIKVEQWTSGSYNYLDHFVYVSQLFSPQWGYGYAGVGLLDDFAYQLGIVLVTLASLAILSTTLRPIRNKHLIYFFYILTILVALLMSPLAVTVWQLIPLATLVQFPWRLLGITAFTLAIVVGSLLADDNRPNANHPSKTVPPNSQPVLLPLMIILASLPYTLPQYTAVPDWAETSLAVINWDRKSIADRVGMVAVTEEQPQTSPLEQQYVAGEPLMVAGIIDGQGELETLHHGGASDRVRVVANQPVTVQFYTYDFPGWQVTLDNQPLEHRPEPPYGLITVDVPAGDHELYLRMGSTPLRTVGTVISGIALLIILVLCLVPRSSHATV